TVAFGAWLHTTERRTVDWHAARVIGLVSLVGVVGGTLTAKALSAAALRTIFAGLLVLVAGRLIHSALFQSRTMRATEDARPGGRDRGRHRGRAGDRSGDRARARRSRRARGRARPGAR